MTTECIPSPSPYAPTIGFSAAVRAGDWVLVSGTTAADSDGEIVGGEDPVAQAHEVVAQDVVRTRIYLVHPSDWEAVGRVHAEAFAGATPAATMLVIGLLDPRMRVEIEALAYAPPLA
jgi:enamine deaminase RidA (YjgF/YER057c/UK114 family)